MKYLLLTFIFVLICLVGFRIITNIDVTLNKQVEAPFAVERMLPTRQIQPTITPTMIVLPTRYTIPLKTQVFQTFNNCGPASLSMLLSYENISVSQEELGVSLRPYQNPQGINDDKSVSVRELATKAEEFERISYYRPNGTVEKMKQFISSGFPVLVRTWLNPDDDIGHYRILRGYDDEAQVFIQDDSYHGKNISIPYEVFNSMWRPFHYEYLVISSEDRKSMVELLIGEDMNEAVAWQRMYDRALSELSSDQSPYSLFTLSVASYYLDNYADSVDFYERALPNLPRRMLWYQLEPIESYLKLNNTIEVFNLTSSILNDQNAGYSEVYILRAQAHELQGNIEEAKKELQKAILYNTQMEKPRVLLEQLSNAN